MKWKYRVRESSLFVAKDGARVEEVDDTEVFGNGVIIDYDKHGFPIGVTFLSSEPIDGEVGGGS